MFGWNSNKISLQKIEKAARNVSGATQIEKTENEVTFRFVDRDGDRIVIFVQTIGEARARVTTGIGIPTSHLVTAMLLSNFYNSLADSHGTFAYAAGLDDDRALMLLEADVITSGGISSGNIRQQLQNFVDRINNFEALMIEGLREIGPDASFLKGDFWSVIGEILGGVLKGFAASSHVNV